MPPNSPTAALPTPAALPTLLPTPVPASSRRLACIAQRANLREFHRYREESEALGVFIGCMRKLRFIPPDGALVEVTMRTIQNRFLLRPGKELNEIIAGILGKAQRNQPLEIIAFAFASNHFHLLLWVDDAERLSKFMAFVNQQLSLEVDRLYDWRGSMWSRRYQAILVSNEEKAQTARLRYILSHGVKEDLVDRMLDWPGIHAGRHLAFGEPLTGYWFDRTKEYAARRRGETFSKYTYATEEIVITSPLPCWSYLSSEKYQQRIVEMIADIESEAEVRRRASGKGVWGVKKVRAQNPHGKPFDSKKTPAPAFHTASKAAYRALKEAYSWFVASFYEAGEKLKNHGNREGFPEGSFPPGLPFVSTISARAP